MDTWFLLKKELNYYGIEIINNKICQISNKDGVVKKQSIIKTVREIKKEITEQQKLMKFLWDELIKLLNEKNNPIELVDDKMIKLFIFSLKDLLRFLLCFENYDNSEYHKVVSLALTKDINSFCRGQIYKTSDYKISIDWVSRIISKLLYIKKLLSFSLLGKKKVQEIGKKYSYDKRTIKIAKGIAGPWAHLDLPMAERVFPFGEILQQREKGKKKQQRYWKGFQAYNDSGWVGEGRYWRELRNEPYEWANREDDDPYPGRSLLTK